MGIKKEDTVGFKEPFGNESEVFYVEELTFENRVDRVSLYGSLDITLDKAGLASVHQLQAVLSSLIGKMESVELPDHVGVIAPVKMDSPL